MIEGWRESAAYHARALGWNWGLSSDDRAVGGADLSVRPLLRVAELLNVLNTDGKDIEYIYASNVAGLDPPGIEVDGRLSRAIEPRSLRAGVKYEF